MTRRKLNKKGRIAFAIMLSSFFLLAVVILPIREDTNNNAEDENSSTAIEDTTGANDSTDSNEEVVSDPDEIFLPEEYFNQTEVVNGVSVIQNTDNMVQLVNKDYYLPSTYVPPDLVVPDVTFAFSDTTLDKAFLREEAANALELMFADAAAQGVELVAVSGYRSYERQAELFEQEVAARGSEEEAAKWVARPGTSEHQTGLAIDISSPSVNNELTEEFGSTKEGIWLQENAHKYGFILRYPAEYTEETGYSYEPWHFRYVGVEVATDMYNRNMCFEVYIQNAKPI